MVNLAPESQRLSVDDRVTLLAHVLAHALRLDLGVALVTQTPALILDEAQIGQLLSAHFAGEALRVPGGVHGLDDPADDEFAAFSATRSEEDVKVVFAVLPALELVEDAVRKRPEALGAHEALWVEQVAVGVDDLGPGLEAVFAASAIHALHIYGSERSLRYYIV